MLYPFKSGGYSPQNNYYMIFRSVFWFGCMMLWSWSLGAQSGPVIGQRAPEIRVTDWVQNVPEQLSVEGKFVVLEFWATWCGPCLKAVPHLNELQAATANEKDVLFLSMTYEAPERIARTLERIDFQTTVVSDQELTTHVGFGVAKAGDRISGAIPQTAVIDRSGTLRWMGLPNDLTQGLLQDLLAGKTVNEGTSEVPPGAPSAPASKPTFSIRKIKELAADPEVQDYFMLQASNSRVTITLPGPSPLQGQQGFHYFGVGITAEALAASLLDIRSDRIRLAETYSGRKVDIYWKSVNANAADELKTIILDSLLSEWELQQQQVRETVTDALSLQVVSPAQLDPSESATGSNSDGGGVQTLNTINLDDLAIWLESELGQVVVNQTELAGNFNFILRKESAQSLGESLESYGLQLVAKPLKVSYLVLESKP